MSPTLAVFVISVPTRIQTPTTPICTAPSTPSWVQLAYCTGIVNQEKKKKNPDRQRSTTPPLSLPTLTCLAPLTSPASLLWVSRHSSNAPISNSPLSHQKTKPTKICSCRSLQDSLEPPGFWSLLPLFSLASPWLPQPAPQPCCSSTLKETSRSFLISCDTLAARLHNEGEYTEAIAHST